MGTSTARKRTGTMAASALTAAAIASAGLGSAPTSNATCASFFGIGNSANCSSTLTTVAIAIGQGAQAQADGVLGAAIALGAGSFTETGGAFTIALATGKASQALANGVFGVASVLGPFAYASTAGAQQLGNLGLNVALNVSPFNKTPYATVALGFGNVAVNLLGTNTGQFKQTFASGIASIGANVGGRDNDVTANGKFFDTAFSAFGKGNTVIAGLPGPFALAGSILQTNKVTTKQKPGFNINGFRVPNTAAAVDASAPKLSAAANRSPRASAAKRAAAKPAAAHG